MPAFKSKSTMTSKSINILSGNTGDKITQTLSSNVIQYQTREFLNHQLEMLYHKRQYDFLITKGYISSSSEDSDSDNETDDFEEEFLDDYQTHMEYTETMNKKIDSYLRTHIPNYKPSDKYTFIIFEHMVRKISELNSVMNKGERILNGMDTKMFYVYIWQFKYQNNFRFSERYLNKSIMYL